MANPGSDIADFCERHTVIMERAAILDAVSAFNERINGCGFYFQWDKGDNAGFISYEELPESTLIIISSFDFCYYYNLEIAFHGVIMHDLDDDNAWPDHWSKDQIMLLPFSAAEQFMKANHLDIDQACHLFAFNIGSHSEEQYHVLAKGCSFHFGTVFYYDRLAQDALQENERIAWWISRKH